jgi:nitrite reductase (cytochrome c-552)
MPETAKPSRLRWLPYVLTFLLAAAATAGVMWLGQSIVERKQEARQSVFRIAELTEDTLDPAEWGKNFPRQYDSYRRTLDIERTRHGGSDAFQKLDDDPRWRIIFKGYPFGVDYREERGHAYMLSDQDMTERVKQFKQPGACLHCHASVLAAYRETGVKAGVPRDEAHRWQAVTRGFEDICAMPYAEARKLVSHPVTCVDCHHPDTMALRVTRPAFINGIRELAKSEQPLLHLPSIERWRQGARKQDYDPNSEATRQEMRSLVCAQCHVEYYFRGDRKIVTYPWHKGLKAEQIEACYDEVGWKDWTHPDTGAAVLKAQHPEFELWSQGIHARSGVACADCHMPYVREGAIKVSDHHVRSPLLNVARACQTCHHFSEAELLARAATIQDRTQALLDRAESAEVDLIRAVSEARQSGRSDKDLERARALHRKAQWRLDFVAAENSMGFHAPQEAARLLAESIDFARQGQIEVYKQGPVAPR